MSTPPPPSHPLAKAKFINVILNPPPQQLIKTKISVRKTLSCVAFYLEFTRLGHIEYVQNGHLYVNKLTQSIAPEKFHTLTNDIFSGVNACVRTWTINKALAESQNKHRMDRVKQENEMTTLGEKKSDLPKLNKAKLEVGQIQTEYAAKIFEIMFDIFLSKGILI